jgi:hypothetical protein
MYTSGEIGSQRSLATITSKMSALSYMTHVLPRIRNASRFRFERTIFLTRIALLDTTFVYLRCVCSRWCKNDSLANS